MICQQFGLVCWGLISPLYSWPLIKSKDHGLFMHGEQIAGGNDKKKQGFSALLIFYHFLSQYWIK